MARGRVQIVPGGRDAKAQAMAVMAELERLAALDDGWQWTRCAVIARQWRWLAPLRSYCEWRGIPVQMANEAAGQCWRLRETQQLLDWLATRESPLVSAGQLCIWLAGRTQSDNPCQALLTAALADYALETGDTELPAAHFREWLAEWGREARRRQNGLLLVSAHRAKGLEFDHVAVLDGEWQAHHEDAAALTRLYYVAMTRARQTLCLARLDHARHPLLDALADGPHLLRRAPVELPSPPAVLNRVYQRPSLKEIDIGFAGRSPAGHAPHAAIAQLAPGAPLSLLATDHGWLLQDRCGITVGKMARDFAPPAGMLCIGAHVDHILVRDKAEADPKYGEPLCERWEIVIPEFIFMPTDGGGSRIDPSNAGRVDEWRR